MMLPKQELSYYEGRSKSYLSMHLEMVNIH